MVAGQLGGTLQLGCKQLPMPLLSELLLLLRRGKEGH